MKRALNLKFGPDEGNSTALIRWGRRLNSGIWLHKTLDFRRWRFLRYGGMAAVYFDTPVATFIIETR